MCYLIKAYICRLICFKFIFILVNELTSVRDISTPGQTPPNYATLELKISQELVDGLPKDTTHVLNIDRTQMKALLAELKLARDVMQKYENKPDS